MSLQSLDVDEIKIGDRCPVAPRSLLVAKRDELDLKLEVTNLTAASLPADLLGHVFIVAPVGTSESGGLPFADGDSFMSGDGMVYRLDFNGSGEVMLKTRLIKSPDYYADLASGKREEYAKYRFNNHGMIRFSPTLGSRNPLSVAFLPVKFDGDTQERLLVTYDAGRQYEIDPVSLKLVTPIGSNQEWQAEVKVNFPFPPVLSTAHPVFDARQSEMLTINYGRSLANLLDLPALPWAKKIWGKLLAHCPHTGKIAKLFWGMEQYIETKLEFLEDFVYLIRWDGTQHLQRWRLVLADGTSVKIKQSIHQIGLSKDYVVIVDTFFTTGLEQTVNNPLPGLEDLEEKVRVIANHKPAPETLVYLVPRAALDRGQRPALDEPEVTVEVVRAKLPPELTHFLVDYDNPQNKITIHGVHASSWYASEWIRTYDRSPYGNKDRVSPHLCGLLPSVMDVSRLGRYVVNGKTGELIEQKKIPDVFEPNIPACRLTWGVTLYAYLDRLPSNPHQVGAAKIDNIYWTSVGLWQEMLTEFVYDYYTKLKQADAFHQPLVHPDEVLELGETGMPSSLFRLATESMSIEDAYEFPRGHVGISPQFVPRSENSSSTDGYIVCTVHCADCDRSYQIWIFDADDLAAGAKWKLSHPDLTFGFTLHTTWLAQIAPRQANYQIRVEDDYRDLVSHNPELKQFFEREIYPQFPDCSQPTA